jgi:serine/threonine-protein kinase
MHPPAAEFAPQRGSTLQRIKEWVPVQLAGEGPLARVYRARPARAAGQAPQPEGKGDRSNLCEAGHQPEVGRGPFRQIGPVPFSHADYALKTLRPEWEDDPRAISFLRREAVVGRTVSHPHLISILAAGISSPPYYVVMPWLTGATLARLAGGGRGCQLSVASGQRHRQLTTDNCQLLPLSTVFWIARQVAEALEALRAAGWMHGDVKPSNIFVGPEGHVTLLDLGFARRIDGPQLPVASCQLSVARGADNCQLTTVNSFRFPSASESPGRMVVAGTYHYMAPEVLTAAMPVDIRSDIYSLGVVIYEMLSGRVPFQGRDPGELARQHRGSRVPDVRRLAPDVPAEAAALVREMVAKEPLRRPQTPRELIQRLIALEIATFSDRWGKEEGVRR